MSSQILLPFFENPNLWHQSISRILNLIYKQYICSMTPVDFTKKMFDIFGGIFDIWPDPVYCQRGRWSFKSKAASTRFFSTDSLRIFSVLLTVWKNVWSDSGFPAFFSKGPCLSLFSNSALQLKSILFMQFWISTNIEFIRWFHEFSVTTKLRIFQELEFV